MAAGVADQDANAEALLAALGLKGAQYGEALAAEGYDTANFLRFATESDLMRAGLRPGHARALIALAKERCGTQAPATSPPAAPTRPAPPQPPRPSETAAAPTVLWCADCRMALNSAQQAAVHVRGNRHRAQQERLRQEAARRGEHWEPTPLVPSVGPPETARPPRRPRGRGARGGALRPPARAECLGSSCDGGASCGVALEPDTADGPSSPPQLCDEAEQCSKRHPLVPLHQECTDPDDCCDGIGCCGDECAMKCTHAGKDGQDCLELRCSLRRLITDAHCGCGTEAVQVLCRQLRDPDGGVEVAGAVVDAVLCCGMDIVPVVANLAHGLIHSEDLVARVGSWSLVGCLTQSCLKELTLQEAPLPSTAESASEIEAHKRRILQARHRNALMVRLAVQLAQRRVVPAELLYVMLHRLLFRSDPARGAAALLPHSGVSDATLGLAADIVEALHALPVPGGDVAPLSTYHEALRHCLQSCRQRTARRIQEVVGALTLPSPVWPAPRPDNGWTQAMHSHDHCCMQYQDP
eukprot:TRINITY_DN23807_c1_g1_i1.p1 TRINITY_DN23807_c1_g1~~TRINITY_DN23807_c1_g1_i1.p1  ORF type:complete len:526 (+),score=153.72 TRINITY_DN23807_c1_g1_i1:85-1662(+)